MVSKLSAIEAEPDPRDGDSFREWFEPLGPDGGLATVLCFPYSGSGASMFARWRGKLAPGVSLFAVRLPGRETRLNEPPREVLLDLAEEIAEAISGGNLARPIVLVGFSLGGLLAFEVARSLRRRGIDIDLLIAGSARAPHGGWSRGKLHRLAEDRFLAKVNELYGAVPQAVVDDPEMRQLLVPMLRADIKMFETYQYRPEPPLPCEIVTLLGTDDEAVQAKHVYPWRELGRSFRHRSFAGGHFFVRTHQQAVLNAINSRVSRLLKTSGASG